MKLNLFFNPDIKTSLNINGQDSKVRQHNLPFILTSPIGSGSRRFHLRLKRVWRFPNLRLSLNKFSIKKFNHLEICDWEVASPGKREPISFKKIGSLFVNYLRIIFSVLDQGLPVRRI